MSKQTIGIVGGGQLGRMLTLAAKKLGFFVIILDSTPNSPAGQVADEQIVASIQDETAIKKLGKKVDFLTFEVELANADVLDKLEKTGVKVNPSGHTLKIIKDKLNQKEFLRKFKIPTADFIKVENKDDIKKASEKFGYPLILKIRFDGYDGRGNFVIKNEKEIDKGLEKLNGRLLYVEKFVPFKKELAVVVARGIKGEVKTFPVVETIHKNNICHIVLSPAPVSKIISNKAEKLAKEVVQKLKGAGVFGIEMFLVGNNVYINEIAPRVHNSGHLTIEACKTSQFEQHIRAITGMPLGDTDMISKAAVMINILGEREGKAEASGLEKVLKMENTYVHIYGKIETRIERKMGHITVLGNNLKQCLEKAKKARSLISI